MRQKEKLVSISRRPLPLMNLDFFSGKAIEKARNTITSHHNIHNIIILRYNITLNSENSILSSFHLSCNGPQAKLKLVLKRSNEEIFVVGGQGSVLIPAVEFEIENDQNLGIVSSDTKTLNRTNSRTNKTAGKTSSDSGKF